MLRSRGVSEVDAGPGGSCPVVPSDVVFLSWVVVGVCGDGLELIEGRFFLGESDRQCHLEVRLFVAWEEQDDVLIPVAVEVVLPVEVPR